MPFQRPTLRQLIDRFRADIRTYTAGGDALLRRSVESVLARAVPGLTHGLWGGLAWIAKQIVPSTADDDYLIQWASLFGLTPKPAAPAITTATFTSDGTTIPVGTLVRRGDAVRYIVTNSSVAAGVVTVELEAEVPGAAGNAPVSTPLSLVSPIAGVDTASGTITDADGIHDGVDIETVESLRGRLVQRMRNPPRGGGPGDYITWALEVPGVTRVWCTPRVQGAGTVGVQFVTDGEANPIPTEDMVNTVGEYLAARAPVTVGRSIDGEWVGVVTTAPTALPLTIEIADLETETGAVLADVRTAIEAEIVDFLRRDVRPGLADGSVILRRSRLDEAISRAAGETSHTLVQPAADIVLTEGQLPIYDSFAHPIIWP